MKLGKMREISLILLLLLVVSGSFSDLFNVFDPLRAESALLNARTNPYTVEERQSIENAGFQPVFIADADIYVPYNYSKIQEAISAADPGDTVFVDAGVYRENVKVNKAVNLFGAGASETILNASLPSDHVIDVTANSANVSGFTLTGATESGKAGVRVTGQNCNMSCNVIATNYYGILLQSSSNNTVTANTVKSNTCGFQLTLSSNNFIYHNNVVNNSYPASDDGNNFWDDGYPSGGNHWSPWTFPDSFTGVNQNVTGDDFLVDYPYSILNGTSKDRYPYTLEDGWGLFRRNTLLVGFKQSVPPATVNLTITKYGSELIKHLELVDIYYIRINTTGRGEAETEHLFEADPNVDFVVLDFFLTRRQHLRGPNDPNYPRQWALNNVGNNPSLAVGVIDADIDAPQAWEHKTDCSDTVVAIIDSGVDLNHPDLAANLWTNPTDPLGDSNGDGNPDDDLNGIVDDIHGAEFRTERMRIGFLDIEFVVSDGTPDDQDGHGTHVAGIIGAVGNNGLGVSGVNWRASIMALKTDGGAISFSAAIEYIVRMRQRGVNVRVVNYSAGISRRDIAGPRPTPPTPAYLARALNAERRLEFWRRLYARNVQLLRENNILLVCAAGYDEVSIDEPDPDGINPGVSGRQGVSDYPCKLPDENIIAVTASNNRDAFVGWANTGIDSVDLAAPGEDILSLSLRGQYRYFSGDSRVSPGDVRLNRVPRTGNRGEYAPGSIVVAGDDDEDFDLSPPLFTFGSLTVRASLLTFMSGTSMATPHVSGAVVNFWSLFPTLSYMDVKNWILQRVDPRPGLQNRVASGTNHDGRLRMISGDDFGDAPDPFAMNWGYYPTKTRYWGASHEDIGEEWLGYYGDRTPEFDADATSNWDGDRVANILPGRVPADPEPPYMPGSTPNVEIHDDGVMIMMNLPGQIILAYSICTAHEDICDFEEGRYLPGQLTVLAPDKRLYINIWIDWNQDGDWDDGELVWSRAHDPSLEWNRTHCSKWKYVPVAVPPTARPGPTWLRVRLDYGENVGPAKYESDSSLFDTYGLAQFGEVEDYPITVTPACQPPPEVWPMYGNDPFQSRYYPGAGPCSNNTIWTLQTGGIMYSSPAIAEGKVFLGSSDGRVYALEAETGTPLWNYTTGYRVDSSPAVVDGTVFVGSGDGNLYALNTDDGQLFWEYATGGVIVSSPIIVDGTVYVGSSDGCLYALNAQTGTLIWKHAVGDWIDSSPAVADNAVYFGSWDGFLYALNATTGNQVWRYDTGDAIVSSPAVVDGKVYIASMNGKIYCLDAQSGMHIWDYATAGPIKGSVAVTCGKVFAVSCDGNAYALHAATGGLIWKSSIGYPLYSSPVVACKQKVYVSSFSEKPSQPPTHSFADPLRDLKFIYNGNPAPPEMYLSCLDVVEGKSELFNETIEFSITVNGGMPPLSHTTFWTVMMDRNNDAEDNSPSYPTENVDTMYSIIYDSTNGKWKIERAIYEPWGWDVTATAANWSMISAYPDGRLIMQISIPLGELQEPLPMCIPWKVKTETFNGAPIGDLAPDFGLTYLSLLHARVYSLSAQTGDILWSYETEGQIYSSPAIANGTLYIGTFDGKLYAFRSLHDVSIGDVTPSKTVVGEGYTANIIATVNNKGDFSETFDVFVAANSTIIEVTSITVDKRSSTRIALAFNSTGLVRGNYTINAFASVHGETNSSDNFCAGVCVVVTIPGDVVCDGGVDIYDAIMLAGAYNSRPDSPSWKANADINGDGIVDIYDAILLANNYGKTT